MDLSFPYPGFLYLLCLIIGAAYALFLYYRRAGLREGPGWVHILLGTLRGLMAAGLVFLLLSPMIRTEDPIRKRPLLLIAQDISGSIPEAMGQEATRDYWTGMEQLMNALEDKYDIRVAGVGESIQESVPDTFRGQLSRIGSVLPHWNELYEYQPVGAAVLATDGIFNAGIDPIYEPYKLNAPLYTIALGDTSIYPDLRIQRTLFNDVVYLGDDMVVEAELFSEALPDARSNLRLERKTDGRWQKIGEEAIRFGDKGQVTSKFKISADRPGINEYRLSLAPAENEKVRGNNIYSFFLDVIDARQRILIIAASPHPDIAAIRQWLADDQRYEIDVVYRQDLSEAKLDADLVIFHQMPDRNTPLQPILKMLDDRKVPRMFITGRQTAAALFNQAQGLVNVKTGGDQFNDAQALLAPDFQLFILEEETRQRLSQFPPLTTFFGEFETSPAARILMRQQISRIETDYPLALMGEQDGVRTAVLLGEGLWRWRLFDQLQHQEDAISREWLAKTIQYLSVIKDQKPFRVNPAKRIFQETEPIVLDARLYNASYELVTTPDIPVTVTDEDGTSYDYFFNKQQERYTLDAGRLAPGSYRYRSSFEWNGERYLDEGSFSVQAIPMESNDLRARHRPLYQLSAANGGTVFLPDQLDALAEELRQAPGAKEVVIYSTRTFPFITLKWPFFLLLFLVTAEWVIRRMYGGL